MPAAKKGPTRLNLPIILIRGFGGLDVEEERALAYQGFNVGSVYPHKRGENYIYEGLILRLLKDQRRYHDATNVVGFFGNRIEDVQELPEELQSLDPALFTGHKIVIDPGMAAKLLREVEDPACTVWVFRYCDLNDDKFATHGEALVRLIDLILNLLELKGNAKTPRMVNIIAHSMGGLIVREAVQVTLPKANRDPSSIINKIVTLGTPHKGITFQLVEDFHWLDFRAEQELEHFNPKKQADADNPAACVNFGKHFPLDRLLTVVGTNYRSYGVRLASLANRLFSFRGEYGPNYNRSDGLVKQTSAQVDGAPRTYVHKCHGGHDSLVTSRETYEIAFRFFRGNVRARLRLVRARVKRKLDRFGKSEIFFGVSIKPRRVDFELFHQSKDAENATCSGKPTALLVPANG